MALEQLTPEQIEVFVQFSHPDKILPWSTHVSESVLAAIYGLDLETYRAIRAKFANRVRQAAQGLLQEQTFARRVDRLPFPPNSVVVGFGDSITDDCQSWLEILNDLLRVRRPQDRIRVVNKGISGDTTSQMMSRFLDVVDLDPGWIIAMPGTNDARFHGQSPSKCLVSIEETEKNLDMLRNFAATQTRARWVWMTPAAVIPEKIAADWNLGPRQLMWRNEGLAAVAEVIRRQPGLIVDLQKVFRCPADPQLLLSDGLHPNLEGQKLIVKTLVERLTE